MLLNKLNSLVEEKISGLEEDLNSLLTDIVFTNNGNSIEKCSGGALPIDESYGSSIQNLEAELNRELEHLKLTVKVLKYS